MQTDILSTFYNRLIPLFKPQAERLVTVLSPDDLDRVAFRYTFSVDAMITISNLIEDTINNTPRVGDLHVSFQYISRLAGQQPRYQQLAQTANGLYLYGAQDETFDFLGRSNVQLIDTENSPLLDYWFVVAYGPGIHQTLLAQEVPSMHGDERYYEGFYTFETDTAYQLLTVLHRLYPAQVPTPTAPENWE